MELSIRSLEIKNFKGIEEIKIDFKQKTYVLGKNGTGKSSILGAISYLLTLETQDGLKTEDSLKTINTDESWIKGIFFRNNEEFELFIDLAAKIYKIRGIQVRNKTQYKESVQVELGVDLGDFIYSLFPFKIETDLKRNSKETKKIRDIIITSAIRKSGSDSLSSDQYYELIESLIAKSTEFKEARTQRSNLVRSLAEFDSSFALKAVSPDVPKWLEEKAELENTVKKFRERDRLFYSIRTKQSSLEQEDYSKEEDDDDEPKEVQQTVVNSKPSIWDKIVAFFMSIWNWLIGLFKKPKSEEKKAIDVEQQRKEVNNIQVNTNSEFLKVEIENLKRKYEPLREQLLKYDIETVMNQLEEITEKIKENTDNKKSNEQLILYKTTKEKELERITKEVKALEIQRNEIEQQKMSWEKETDEMIRTLFSFEIKTINEKSSPVCVIVKNGLEYKQLNTGEQRKIAIEVNEYLKTGVKTNPFIMVDNAESLSDVVFFKDKQIIESRVTQNDKLTIEYEYTPT